MSLRFNTLFATGVLVAAMMTLPVVHAEELATYRFDLPAQPLAEALRAIARQTGRNVLFASKDLRGIQVPALAGQLTPKRRSSGC